MRAASAAPKKALWLEGAAWPFLVLALAVAAAYANAFHTELVFDDRVFAVAEDYRGLGWRGIAGLFGENTWAGSGTNVGLYRPLLLLSIAIDAFLFGDWLPGYRLVNVLLHLLASFAVFGLSASVLEVSAPGRGANRLCALLAGVVFAVHPLHTEVVNSIFNRSESIITLGIAAGLWWLLPQVRQRPWLAWGGLATIYLPLLLVRESAITLPALAVALVWLTASESWREKLRFCWPVVLLIIPLALYAGMRISAMENTRVQAAPMTGQQVSAASEKTYAWSTWNPLRGVALGAAEIAPEPAIRAANNDGLLRRLQLEFSLVNLERATHLALDGLFMMVWPHPLAIYHDPPTGRLWWALAFQLALLGVALWGWFKGRPGLLVGLAFYYIAILPSSRIIAETSVPAVINERLLYLPSIGPALALAFGLGGLINRFGFRPVTLLALLVALTLTPVTWARNADWSDEIRLFETDYAKLHRKDPILYTLVKAYLEADDVRKATAMCDKHPGPRQNLASLINHCALAYDRAGRHGDAETAFLAATKKPQLTSMAHFNLARMYLRLDRHEDARMHFAQAVEAERIPALKAFQQGYSLMLLYPYDPVRKAEARTHLERALELQPRLRLARQALAVLDS